jgi:hypothetical protein
MLFLGGRQRPDQAPTLPSLELRTPRSSLARRSVVMQTPSLWAAVSMAPCVRLPPRELAQPLRGELAFGQTGTGGTNGEQFFRNEIAGSHPEEVSTWVE